MTALVSALLLAGCGGDSGNGVAELEPQAIVERAREAAKAQERVAVDGSVEEQGQSVTVDLLLTNQGQASGTLALGEMEVRLVADGDRLFLGTDIFASQGVTVPEGVEFVEVPPGEEGFEQVEQFTDLAAFFDQALAPEGELSREEGAEVNGTPTVAVVDSSEDGGRLLIATEGEPLPLRIEGAAPGQQQISFDFATTESVEVPSPEQVVPLEQLVGGQG